MRRLRQKTSGVVTRKIATDSVVRTIFGTEEVAMLSCTCCKKLKYKFEFYLESASKRKYPDQTRKQCVECWDLYKGNSNTDIVYCETAQKVEGFI